MLRIYRFDATKLIDATGTDPVSMDGVVWMDLFNPTAEEDRQVEALLGIAIPTLAEMEEIELSARLYNEDDAEYMTMTGLVKLDTEEPVKTALTFILKGRTLVTVRFAEPKPFQVYLARASKAKGVPCGTGEQVMLGLIEAMIDRTADALERVGNEIDQVSRDVFRKKTDTAKKVQQDLRSIVERIGAKAELLTMVQESLVSISRLTAYHIAAEDGPGPVGRDTRQLIKLIQRDAVSLGEHARTLSTKINFLLDATLGFINLEQNQIIKIFSVAAVVFLPPTLVASIYGMNFEFMPELAWYVGYPFALCLMIMSAVVPFLYFKRRGWL